MHQTTRPTSRRKRCRGSIGSGSRVTRRRRADHARRRRLAYPRAGRAACSQRRAAAAMRRAS
eukprot:6870312-Prymnesium_polylepis.2